MSIRTILRVLFLFLFLVFDILHSAYRNAYRHCALVAPHLYNRMIQQKRTFYAVLLSTTSAIVATHMAVAVVLKSTLSLALMESVVAPCLIVYIGYAHIQGQLYRNESPTTALNARRGSVVPMRTNDIRLMPLIIKITLCLPTCITYLVITYTSSTFAVIFTCVGNLITSLKCIVGPLISQKSRELRVGARLSCIAHDSVPVKMPSCNQNNGYYGNGQHSNMCLRKNQKNSVVGKSVNEVEGEVPLGTPSCNRQRKKVSIGGATIKTPAIISKRVSHLTDQ